MARQQRPNFATQRVWLTGLLVLSLMLALLRDEARIAWAAGADNVTGATALVPPLVNDTTNNGSATRDPGEAGTCGAFPDAPSTANTRSLWYRYTATGPGWLTVHTRNSTYDTVLEVYTSTLPSPTAADLVTVGCNDDIDTKTPVRQSQVTLLVSSGTTYYIAIRSFGSSATVGTASFSASLSPVQDLYVALTGDNSNAGSADAPFRTIQHAVDVASASGDTVIHVLDAGPYGATDIDKAVELLGTNTTAASLTLSNGAALVSGTTGISAPVVIVNPGSPVQDGLRLAASGGTVNLAAGTFTETVAITQSVTLQGPATGSRAVLDPAGGNAVQISAGTAITLAHLDIQGAAIGVLATGGSNIRLYRDNIIGNTVGVSATVSVTATENWWGSASGPAHATNPGGAGQPVSDNVTFSPWCSTAAPNCVPLRGPISQLVFTTQPSDTFAGSPITPAVVVEARDSFGNVAAGYTGTVDIDLGANPGGSTLGTTSQMAASGVVTYTNLSLDQPGVGYTLVASTTVPGAGVITATSAAFDIFNNAPTANPDTGSMLEDGGSLAIDVLANDSDPEIDNLLIVGLIQPANGSVITSATGVTYTPALNFFGTDVFTYTITDEFGSGTDSASVSMTVNPVNDAPSFAKGADQTVNEDSGARTVSGWATSISPGPNESSQTVTFVVTNTDNSLFSTQPAVSPAGTLTFTPAANAFGSATVFISLSDNGGTVNGGVNQSAAQTFLITINPVNDAPSFSLPTTVITVTEDAGAFSQDNFATSLSPGPPNEAGQTLTFNLSNTNPLSFTLQPSLSPTGTLAFTPALNAVGTITVTVTLQDNGGTTNGGQDASAPQTFTIVITPQSDPPDAVDDARTTNEDTPLTFDPRSNDTDPDIDPLSVVAVGATPGGTTGFTASSVTYTPAADFNGTTVFTYTVSDGALTDTATITVTVNPVNDAPTFTLSPNSAAVLEDSGLYTATVAAGIQPGPATATDEAGQALSFLLTPTFPLSFTVQPTLSVATGVISFTLAPDAFGVVTVSVRLQDSGWTGNGGVDTSPGQIFTITIDGVNDGPSFAKGADQNVNEDAGAQTLVGWASGITAGPGEITQTVTFGVTSTNPGLFSAGPAVASNGTLTFTPAGDANGSATVFVTALDDGGTLNGGVDISAAQSFVISVNAVNDAPSFSLPTPVVTVTEDSGLFSQSGFANSILPGPLSATDEAGQTVTFTLTNTNPAIFSGQPSLSPTGTLTFQPAPNASGAATVTVTLRDSGGTANGGVDTSAPQTFTIVITPQPDTPLAANDVFTVAEDGGAANLAVLANDTSVDGGTLSVLAVTAAANGAVNAGPPLTYAPTADYFGPDSFTYTITDTASGLTATAGVSLTVLPVNDAPSFTKGVDITVTEDAGAVTFFNWATNLSRGPANESGQVLTFTLTNTLPGLFSVQPVLNASNGMLTFTLAPNAFGSATVTVGLQDSSGTANGGQDTSVPQTFMVTVTPTNDPPTAVDDSVSVLANSLGNVLNVLANDSIAPDAGETLTIVAVTPAANGAVSLGAGGGSLVYTPTAAFTGVDMFTYTISDGNGGTDQATVTVNVGATQQWLFLPMITREARLLPDLVSGFSLSPANPGAGQPVLITVVITNQGAVVTSSGFWVDFYINPNPPPNASNQPWNGQCGLSPCYGLAWYVPQVLGPGESVTLTSTPNGFCQDGSTPSNPGGYCNPNTVWPTGAFASGTNALYVYVDSWNPGVATGAVLEGNESNNLFSQTGFGPLEASRAGEVGTVAETPFQIDLPPRQPQPTEGGE